VGSSPNGEESFPRKIDGIRGQKDENLEKKGILATICRRGPAKELGKLLLEVRSQPTNEKKGTRQPGRKEKENCLLKKQKRQGGNRKRCPAGREKKNVAEGQNC